MLSPPFNVKENGSRIGALGLVTGAFFRRGFTMFKFVARTLGAIGDVAQVLADFSGFLLLALLGVAVFIPVCIMAWFMIRSLFAW